MSPEAKQRILLVDDHKNLLITLGDYLEFSGFQVVRARSGEEALAEIANQKPDIVILDISMPGMSGLAFLKKISGPDGKSRYPVLVFTARANMGHFFSETAVDGFLAKTSDPSCLIAEIQRILLKYKKASRAAAGAGQRPRLMIIENEPRLGARLRSFFSAAGYETTILESSARLLESLREKIPHVILIKEILPNETGNAIAAGIASFTTASGISVILYDTSGLHPADAKFPNVDRFVTSNTPPDLLAAVASVSGSR